MKLRNKKTGKIIDAVITGENNIEFQERGSFYRYTYGSLSELNEEWEDYEEQTREYWCIDWDGTLKNIIVLNNIEYIDEYEEDKKEIGNHFKNKEEAEKAVEKLKAWKKLKDKGFQFVNFTLENGNREGLIQYMCEQPLDKKELTNLFGSKS